MRMPLSLRSRAGALLCAIACTLALPARADDALFRDLGGEPVLRRVAADLVAIALEDSRIRDTFRDVDLDRLRGKLAEQFCAVSGGPCKYTGKDMKTIHEDLKIGVAQFNALAEDLQLALERNGVPFVVQNRLIARLAPMHRDIVTR